MILLLDTTSSICQLTLIEGDWRFEAKWEANRELAKGLLGYMESELRQNKKTFGDIDAIGVLRGPGSFTSLRIGITVLNTLADALHIPIVGESGEDWQEKAIAKIENGQNEEIILPLYGSDANITQPRK